MVFDLFLNWSVGKVVKIKFKERLSLVCIDGGI